MLTFNGYTSKAQAVNAVNKIIQPMGHTLGSVLGTPESNVKLNKSPIRTFPLNLMPADSSGIMNTCPHATEQCKKLCLHTAGNPVFLPTKIKGRMARTYAFKYARKAFIAALCFDIHNKVKNAKADVAFRLNTTSDIAWEKCKVDVGGENTTLMAHFDQVKFYDYTKHFARAMQFANGLLPANYHLTLSLSEDNDNEAEQMLQAGGTVAACVEYNGDMPITLTLRNGSVWPTYNADKSDYRPDDPMGSIGVLYPKGKAKNDEFKGGFTRVV